ncbi:MAG: S-layer homology domain-containing protein, partial [Bacillota bacterium]
LTITAADDEKVYDGDPLTNNGYEHNLLATGDNIEGLKVEGSITDVGTKANVPSGAVIKNNEGENVTDCYEIEYHNGILTVTPRAVMAMVNGNCSEKDYNGQPQSVTGFNVSYFFGGEMLPDTDNIKIELKESSKNKNTVTKTDVGTYPMGLTKDDFTVTASDNYSVELNVTDGELIINKLPVTVTITGNHEAFNYDGGEHSVVGYTVSCSSELYSEKDIFFSGTAEAKGINVGRVYMGLSKEKFGNKNSNFDVSFVGTDGYVDIKPITDKIVVKIKEKADEYIYNGNEFAVSGWDVTDISNPLYKLNDFQYIGGADKITVKGTDAGTYDMDLAVSDFKNINTNYANVEFVIEDGVLTITERPLTVTADSAEKTYDGNALTKSSWTQTGLADGHQIDVTVTGSQTDADSSDNTPSNAVVTDASGADVTSNYDITYKKGSLKVNPLRVNVNILGSRKENLYDKAEHAADGYTVTADSKLYSEEDILFSGTAEAKRIEVGTTAMGLTAEKFANKNSNFTVTFNVLDGWQRIIPVADEIVVTITEISKSFTYDGTEKAAENYSFEISGGSDYTKDDFKYVGDAAKLKVGGVAAGTYNMELTAGDFENKNKNYTNVKFVIVDGVLTITERPLTVTADSAEKTYDGNVLTKSSWTQTGLADGHQIDVTVTGSQTDADSSDNTPSNAVVTDASGANVTSNYDITYKKGSLKVNPRAVTVRIVGNDRTVTYDRAEHSVSGYRVSASSSLYTAEDYTFSGKAEAKRTEFGKTDMGLDKNDFKNNNNNFIATFIVTDGYLQINPVTDEIVVNITEASKSFTYDGTEKTAENYSFEISGGFGYIEDDFQYVGDAAKLKVSGTDAGTYNMELTAGDFENKNKNYTNVKFVIVDGALTIAPKEVTVTVTGNSETVRYNGKEQRTEGYTVTLPEGVTEDAVAVKLADGKEAVAKGIAVGEYPMNLTAEDFTVTSKNYNVSLNVIDGKLIVKSSGSANTGVILTKVDSNDRTAVLKGAEFELYNGNDKLVGTYTTDKNGQIRLPNLTPGDYYFVEIAPPECYLLDSAKHKVTVTRNKMTELVIANVRTATPEDLNNEDAFSYIIGYEDGTVRPNSGITRAEVATIFFRLLKDDVREANLTKANDYKDVNSNDWYCSAVSTLSAMGIINGYEDGTFNPNGTITRAEFAAIAARFEKNGNNADAGFTDTLNHWAKGEINIAANNGWILGYEDGTFRPDQNISRAEVMTLVNRVLNRMPETVSDLLPDMVKWTDNSNTESWYYLAVQEATNSHYYDRKDNGYIKWTELRENRDWSVYEK